MCVLVITLLSVLDPLAPMLVICLLGQRPEDRDERRQLGGVDYRLDTLMTRTLLTAAAILATVATPAMAWRDTMDV